MRDVEKLLNRLVGLKSHVRGSGCVFLNVCTNVNEVTLGGDMNVISMSLSGVSEGHYRGMPLIGYQLAPQAVDYVIQESLKEVQSLKSKVKQLEQQLQAIDNVLKESV